MTRKVSEPAPAGGRTHVALLRGINVGRAKRVAMADLRALVEELGYADVRTLLNSGNVAFAAPNTTPRQVAGAIEKALVARTGVSSRVLVLTAAQVDTVVAENSLGETADNPSRLMVSLLFDPADRVKLEPLAQQDWAKDALAVGTLAAYAWCADGILESRLIVALNRALGDSVTTRNWATVLKLRELLREGR
jgi:uncharacterized protein (DUF1697 family)